jgi:tRNA threonylcarbamoyladenosine biosynthesis protein TsaB
MRILALDTTTRSGSVALIDRHTVVAAEAGDPARTHGERLPTDIIRLLAACQVSLADIDVFAVAAGPGSFTGLRIGIATMQGLAAANRKGLIGLSALDALALGARRQIGSVGDPADSLAAWMDAQRGEVFAALYSPNLSLCDGPLVASPEETLSRWAPEIPHAWFVGDGALRYRDLIARDRVVEPTPLIAPAIGLMAAERVETVPPPSPEAIRPLYVRRPDAELARDRHKVQTDR